jgi:hypothetical protein
VMLVQPSFAPIAALQECTLDVANHYLVQWDHKMGPLKRPKKGDPGCHVLLFDAHPVAITATSTLIRLGVGGGLRRVLTRENTVELSRLCAMAPGLCRIMLRMWREFVFPSLGYDFAISYQDRDIHTGNTYRFDGWVRVRPSRAGGIDQRSGRAGRHKWIWAWSRDEQRMALLRSLASEKATEVAA